MRFAIHLNFAIEIGGKTALTSSSWSRMRRLVKSRDDAVCYHCGKRDSRGHVDHLIPLSKGGSDDPSNLVWSCRKCNSSKSDLTVSEWEAKGEGGPMEREIAAGYVPSWKHKVALHVGFAKDVLANAVTFSERGANSHGYSREAFSRLRDYLEEHEFARYLHEDKRQGMELTESGVLLFESVANRSRDPVLELYSD